MGTAKKPFKTSLIGKVANEFSNFLSVLAIDASSAHAWKGPSKSGKGDDYARALKSVEKGAYTIAVGSGKGTVAEIGGCGVADVHRPADNTLVMAEFYAGEDAGTDEEAELFRTILEGPTARRPKKLGSVAISSGVVALLPLVESGEKITTTMIEAVAKSGAPKEGRFGLLVPMANGDYEVWRDDFEAKGSFGSIGGRVRIVPAGTRVVPGEPIAQSSLPHTAGETSVAKQSSTANAVDAKNGAQKKSPSKKGASTQRFLAEGWTKIDGFARAKDGSRIVAGERGGYRIGCWDAGGVRLWERTLPPAANMAGFESVVAAVGPDAILATCPYGEGLYELDLESGETRRVHPFRMQSFVLAPDGQTLVMKMGVKGTPWKDIQALVCRYPSLAVAAEIREPSNVHSVAFSADSSVFARPSYDEDGYRIQVFDAATGKIVHTFPIEGLNQLPSAMSYSPKGTLAAGFRGGSIRFFEARKPNEFVEVDAAPERAKKPNVSALAYDETGGLLGVGRDDATVVVLDGTSRKVASTFDKLDPAAPPAIALSGARLFVSVGPKGGPVGLAVFDI